MDLKGLENKLAAHVGDILLLETDDRERVIGYIKEFTHKTVTLCQDA